ncbi:peroxide stress protein YaaA [Candidatus Pacearchaeota archaeon]|nr:peroxide stress protein YaaA [Candidatus Pacearchaeota archaeon]
MPAIDRYDGRFYKTLGEKGKEKLLRSQHHVLILSGLYGLVTPREQIQLYSCPIEEGSKIQEIWKKHNGLTRILVEYIKINKIKRVFDLTSRKDYRELINWNTMTADTRAEVLHCFSTIGGGDDALIPFGEFMKNYMLEASEGELLAIKPETEIAGIVIRDVPETLEHLPKEDLISISQAEKEIHYLEAYPIEEIPNKFNIGQSSDIRGRGDWFISLTPEFMKNLRHIGDKRKEGRILWAITEISQKPTEPRGNIAPLRGSLEDKWRYRMDNYRIIYFPDTEKRIVFLLLIKPRRNIYD